MPSIINFDQKFILRLTESSVSVIFFYLMPVLKLCLFNGILFTMASLIHLLEIIAYI